MGISWESLTEKELAKLMSENPPENEPVPTPVENGTDNGAPDLSHVDYEAEPEFADPLAGENDDNSGEDEQNG